jgi:ornithine carbamoyltransferase
MKRHFLTLADFTQKELGHLLRRAIKLKEDAREGRRSTSLGGMTLGLLFEKPSLRTRVTFEVAMRQLGGGSFYMSANEVQLGVRESVSDVARNLGRWIDGIVLRTFRHEVVEEMAQYSSIPVINGLTDRVHPCQILSDMLTLREKKGRLRGFRMCYLGDGNNVANSWLLGASAMGMDLSVACPQGCEPNKTVLRVARRRAEESGARIAFTNNPRKAAKNADVIYTDVWTSMGSEWEGARRGLLFKDFQVNPDLLSLASRDVLVMHCLPAHRGEEITDEVLDGPHSIVFDQAENRLHAQKALLEAFLGRSRGKP